MKAIISAICLIFFLSSCSDSGSGSVTSTSNKKVAYFEDSLVNGLTYKCDNIEGITGDYNNEDGSFQYTNDCDIIFSIGKIHLGSIHGAKINTTTKKIYPTSLFDINITNTNDTRVVNIIRFLQSLDENNDSSDGIVITSAQRENLFNANSLDLTDNNISISDLNLSVISADSSKTLISKNKALEHFEQTLRTQVDPNIDTIGPNTPFLTTNITAINNSLILNKTVELNGEAGSTIFIAYNTSGDESNLNFIKQSTPLNNNGKLNLVLSFNDNSASNFHYYIYLEDKNEYKSEILHINVFKDILQPVVVEKNLTLSVFEQQNFIQNINASDNSTLKYEIVSKSEDSNSVDYTLFQIDSTGNITFIVEPNYDDNVNITYGVVARAIDEAGNKVDVTVNVSLINILDNPPVLSETFYEISILEEPQNGDIIFDSNTTIDTNLTKNPDNDPALSPILFKLQNNTDIFEINSSTGKLSIKDTSDDLFDYEKTLKNTIDLNISVENNNTTASGNISYETLRVNILNKIDTTPSFTLNNSVSINEHNNPNVVIIDTASINTTLSDFDTTMVFTFNNNLDTSVDGNFKINQTSGEITTFGDNLDYESTNNYILTVRATNILNTSKSINNFFDVNISVDILNVIDMAPSISFTIINAVIPESTDVDFKVATIDLNGSTNDQNTTNSFEITSIGTPFKIDTSNGDIFTSRSLLSDYNETLDNNSHTSISLNVIAKNTWWDNSTNNSNTVNFDINITNVIDNVPVLGTPPSILNFDENTSTPIGTTIYSITKNPLIYDQNVTTKYSIVSGNIDNQFDFNSTTGELTLNKLFNWEDYTSHNLFLNASNMFWDGSENNSSSVLLSITINNIIEKPPKIISSISNIEIHENINVDEIISIIKVDSLETDEQNITTFLSLTGGNGNFIIDPLLPLYDSNNLPYTYLKINNPHTIDWENLDEHNISIHANNDNTNLNTTNVSSDLNLSINIINDVDTNVPLLVLLIQFNDVNFSSSFTDIKNYVFNDLNEYLQIVSKDKFQFINANENYGQDNNISEEGVINDGVIKVNLNQTHPQGDAGVMALRVKQALQQVSDNNYIDFSNFDIRDITGKTSSTSDGNVSAEELQILVLMAEDENNSILAEHEGVNSFSSNLQINGVNIGSTNSNGSYVVNGESDNNATITFGTIAKILSENLFNFKKDNSEFVFDNLGLMGEGFSGFVDNNLSGTSPVHPSVYNKIEQGWNYPQLLIKNIAADDIYNIIFINTHNNSNKFNTVKINSTTNSNLYYLIENRHITTNGSKTNFDNGLGGLFGGTFKGGLVIWKVDTLNDTVGIVEINNSNNTNVYRPTNTNSDLPDDVRSVFEFNDSGTITGDLDDGGTKTFTIGIKVK